MDKQTWTPEPWYLLAWSADTADEKQVFCTANIDRTINEAEANAKRIVACVNALAGIDSPAAFVERAKRAEEGLQIANDLLKKRNQQLESLEQSTRELAEALKEADEFIFMAADDSSVRDDIRKKITALLKRANLGE